MEPSGQMRQPDVPGPFAAASRRLFGGLARLRGGKRAFHPDGVVFTAELILVGEEQRAEGSILGQRARLPAVARGSRATAGRARNRDQDREPGRSGNAPGSALRHLLAATRRPPRTAPRASRVLRPLLHHGLALPGRGQGEDARPAAPRRRPRLPPRPRGDHADRSRRALPAADCELGGTVAGAGRARPGRAPPGPGRGDPLQPLEHRRRRASSDGTTDGIARSRLRGKPGRPWRAARVAGPARGMKKALRGGPFPESDRVGDYATRRTPVADGPFGPCSVSNSTLAFSDRVLKPSPSIELKWTKTSLEPSSGV